MFLECQNQSLAHAVAENKRLISEVRLDLEMMQEKARMLEGLLCGVQRTWSQLEIDLTMLMDDIGSDASPGSSALGQFQEFLSAGAPLALLDPLHIDPHYLPVIDKWHSIEEMQAERVRVEEALSAAAHEAPRASLGADGTLAAAEEVAAGMPGMAPLPPSAASYACFVASLLERLCAYIHEAALFRATPRVLSSIAAAKELFTERFLMTDKITKLSVEIVNTSHKLYALEQRRAQLESELHPQSNDGAAACEELSAGSSLSKKLPGDTIVPYDQRAACDDEPSLQAQVSRHRSLREQVCVLEAQAAEAEVDKEGAELALSATLASNLVRGDDESIVAIKKIFSDFRAVSHESILTLQVELGRLNDKAANLELALLKAPRTEQALVDKAAAAAQSVASAMQGEIDGTRAEVAAMQRGLAEASKGRRLGQLLLTAAKSDSTALVARLRQAQADLDASRAQLLVSRDREQQLVCELSGAAAGAPRSCPREFKATAVMDTVALQEYLSGLREEARHAEVNIKDLSLEIESVLQDESSCREQLSVCLPQAQEALQSHSSLLEENVRLGAAIEACVAAAANVAKKTEVLAGLAQSQEAIAKRLRDGGLAAELSAHHARAPANPSPNPNPKGAETAAKKLAVVNKDSVALRARCDELAVRCEQLREARMAKQRSTAARSVECKEAAGARDGEQAAGAQDAELLEASLSMLRCSVCKDRFKCVAIARCYHLFCKECIDENLRNRQRKCPACGEKFGADDVRTLIY